MSFISRNYWWMVPALLAIGGWYWYESEKKKQPPKKDANSDDDTPPLNSSLDKSAKLYNGVQGKKEEVKYLQNWLNINGASPKVSVDGIFGEKTAVALKQVKGVFDTTLNKL